MPSTSRCVQGLEWRLSEKDAEIAAAKDRLELVEQRQAMEMGNLSQSLEVCTNPWSDFQPFNSATGGRRNILTIVCLFANRTSKNIMWI